MKEYWGVLLPGFFIYIIGSTTNLMEIQSGIFSIVQLPKSQWGNWLTKVDKVVTEIGFEGYFIEQWAY